MKKVRTFFALFMITAMVFSQTAYSAAWAEEIPEGERQESVEEVAEEIEAEQPREDAAEDASAVPEDPAEEVPAEDAAAEENAFTVPQESSGEIGTMEESAEESEVSVSFSEDGEVYSVQLYGEAAEDADAAAEALKGTLELEDRDVDQVVSALFDEQEDQDDQSTNQGRPGKAPAVEDPDVPRQGDGSSIDVMTAKWLTQDSVDNDDPDFLYFRPGGDSPFSVRLQLNYALSGEHPYEPGDITITIPVTIFKDRNGKDYSDAIIPFPEDPLTKADFNWKQIGDNIVITNTKKMSAATKGYIQIAFDELIPHELVDMLVSEPFDAYIEVLTHKGNTIASHSNSLTAQFDTEAKVTDVSKKVYGDVERVPASAIPASQRIEGETEYIKVNWYVWGATNANTLYTLKQLDYMPDEYDGFIIGANSADGLSLEETAYTGWASGQTSYYYYSTAYPASQFEPDTDYTFHNNIKFTVTEADPAAEVTNPNVQEEDPRLVTEKTTSAQVVWSYSYPEWQDPSGHFMVTKNGNDYTANSYRTRHKLYQYDTSDLHIWSSRNPISGWYGVYPSALNDMMDGDDVLISYTIDSVGYVMPWMFDSAAFDTDGEVASRLSKNYTRPVTIATEDTGVSIGRNGEKLTIFDDYEFVALEFPKEPWIYTGIPHNINPDGTWTALTAGDGTFLYSRDTDRSHMPEFKLALLRNGEWEDYASVSWASGEPVITLTTGQQVSGGSVNLPSDTENFRVTVTLQNTSTDEEANTALQAAIDYDIRPVIRLKKTEAMDTLIEAGFANSTTPEILVYNSCEMTASRADTDETIVEIEREGYDSLRGYTTDTMVYPYKSSYQSLKDVDNNNRIVTIHYNARVEERSVINDKTTYERAIADGRLISESYGVWRDLLPKGATPVLSSIKLREGDSIIDARAITNYENSGRTLLVVEAKLSPVPVRYRSGDMYYYMDVPSISFDATYGFDSITDYGDYIHNVISFESGNDTIGTVDKYRGEPDDPRSSNNVSTVNAFSDDTEKDVMTDLDKDRDTDSFVYAGTYTKIDILAAARTSLFKDVMTNDDGLWSDGLYYGYPEENKRTVYEGGIYSYRLRMMPDEDTIAKDMIIYDSLENFYAADGNDEVDIDAPRWHGTLRGVDVSQLEDKGCDPVVYYSTVEGLELSDPADPHSPNDRNVDLSNSDVWVKAEDYDGELSDVKAVAVDASRTKDGGDFELKPQESAVVVINMTAPSGDEAREYLAQKGVWGDSANAYNNAYLMSTTVDVETQQEETGGFIRKDYTKVGLMEYKFEVSKIWDDDNDRDGVRPDSKTGITIHLYADGVDTGLSLKLPVIDEETGEEIWSGSFDHIPYTDENGNKIHYTAVEEVPEGYTAKMDPGESGVEITNTHEPERISLSGRKTWTGDEITIRPSAITVRLYADGKYLKSIAVTPDAKGNWEYTFTNLLKYRDGGVEIEYTVDELMGGTMDSYIPDVDGMDITNTYHPFGDLRVTKTLEDATEVSSEQEFILTFNFTRTESGEEIPVFTEYDYEILDADGTQISTGTVANNGTIAIKGGQTVHVMEIEQGVHYKVTESEEAGFTQFSSFGTEGTIYPNKTSEAGFTNKYSASGRINLNAEKTLEWSELKRALFRFELYEVKEDGTEELLRVATNERPDDINVNENGVVESSHAEVIFGAIRYDQADHGKTFTYKIKEFNAGRDGFTYDASEYIVKVTVTDNGDGTLTITPVYYKDGEEVESAAFDNVYAAEGEVVLRAWKDLHGGRLQEGQFTFELIDEDLNVIQTKTNSSDGTIVFDPIHYDEKDIGRTFIYGVREKAGTDRTVIYDKAVYGYSVEVLDNGDGTLSFNQGFAEPIYEDKTCLRCMGGKFDENEDTAFFPFSPYGTAQYEEGQEYATVTLSEKPGFSAGDRVYETLMKIIEKGEVTYGEINTYIGPDETRVDKLPIRHTFEGTDAEIAQNWRDIMINSGSTYRSLLDSGNIDTNEHADVPESDTAIWYVEITNSSEYEGTWGVNYILGFIPACPECGGTGLSPQIVGWNTGEGEIPVFSNSLKPGSLSITKNTTNTANADPNQEFHFKVKLIGEDLEDGEIDYMISYNGQVSRAAARAMNRAVQKASLEVKEGAENDAVPSDVELPDDIAGELPDGTGPSVEIVEPDPEDFCDAESTGEEAADEYTTGSLSGSRLLDVFAEPVYGAEDDIDGGVYDGVNWRITSDWELIIGNGGEQTYTWQNYRYNFPWSHNSTYRNKIRSARFDGIVHGNGSMNQMFFCMSNLETVDTTGFETSQVTQMGSMFDRCEKLTVLDVSSWDTSRVTDMNYLFYNCHELTELDVSGWNTSNVTKMNYMFCHLEKVEVLDVSGFDTSKVTNMNSMFMSCKKVKELDVSRWNTSRVTDMMQMFHGCNSVEVLDVSRWNTSSATDMKSMFASCSSLTVLDVSSFDTSKVTDMMQMFGWVYKVKELDLSSFDTSNVYDMRSMFAGDSALKKLDLSNFNTSKVGTRTPTSILSRGDMSYMFASCWSMEELDISGFDTSNVTQLQNMFQSCSSLMRINLGEKFSFKGKGNISTTNQAILPTPNRWGYTGKWIMENEAFGPMTAEQLRNNYNATMQGVWIWEEKPPAYTIYFDPGMAYGYMSNETAPVQEDFTLPSNTFYRMGYIFDHWEDDRGNTYPNRGVIPAFTYEKNDYITLKAVFIPYETKVDMKDGEFDLYLHGGETATFMDLPAGTAYQVYEETPDGWVLIQQSNTSGTIAPLTNSEASFTNRYQPGVATAQFVGSKTLDGAAAEGYSFGFQLTEVGNEQGSATAISNGGYQYTMWFPYTVSVMNGGLIQFPVLLYEGPGTHVYEISEVDWGNPNVILDSHVETVTVEVTDDGAGHLSADVSYASGLDHLSFANFTKPGSLAIKKTAESTTDANKDDVFTVKVTLNNDKGLPFTGDVDWYTVDAEGNTVPNAEPAGAAHERGPNGEIYVYLKAGDTVMIPDLPAGTRYTMEEVDLPTGWTLVTGEGIGGTIYPANTSEGSFSNRYSAEGEAYIQAHKAMPFAAPEKGQFTFELLDSDHELIERMTNDALDTAVLIYDEEGNASENPYKDTAPVIFSPITFDQDDIGKTFTYYIRETLGDDSGIIYDEHEETVTVEVVDRGKGFLEGIVTYDEDGAVFENSLRPSSLKVEKTTVGSQDPEAEFTFTFRLTDKDGQEISGEYTARKYPKAEPDAETTTEPAEFTIASGGTFTLKDGEYVIIEGLPAGASYEVTESEDPNWILTEKEGDTGELKAGEQSAAGFVNTFEPKPYSADGKVQLKAYKTMLGGTIKEEDELVFELLNEAGDVLQRKPVDEFGSETGTITFDEIAFTLDDMDGLEEKTFFFYIREQSGTDPNMTYDSKREVEVRVTVKDDGEGHLNTFIAYDTDEEGTPSGEVRFTNTRRMDLKVIKKEKDTETILPDAVFSIRQDGKYLNASGILQEEEYLFTTDEKGEISVKGVSAGTYTLHEESAPEGYLPAEDIEFTLYDGDTLIDEEIVNAVIVEDEKEPTGYTDLIITKNMPERIDASSEGFNSTAVFEVTGYDKDGNVVYQNHVGIAFDNNSGASESKELNKIPMTAVKITVREVYAGSYKPAQEEITKTELEEVDGRKIWTFEFTNLPGTSTGSKGGAIVNEYEFTEEGIRFKGAEGAVKGGGAE